MRSNAFSRLLLVALLILTTQSQAQVSIPENSANNVYEQKFYNVSGLTGAQINAAIKANSPNPSKADGLTEIVPLKVKYTAKQTGNGFIVKDMIVTSKIITTLPNWTDYNSAPNCQPMWNNYISALKKHEDGHKKKYEEYAPTLVSQAYSLAPQASPEALKAVLKSINEKIKNDIRTWQVKYDQTTKYGQTQGVVMSPC